MFSSFSSHPSTSAGGIESIRHTFTNDWSSICATSPSSSLVLTFTMDSSRGSLASPWTFTTKVWWRDHATLHYFAGCCSHLSQFRVIIQAGNCFLHFLLLANHLNLAFDAQVLCAHCWPWCFPSRNRTFIQHTHTQADTGVCEASWNAKWLVTHAVVVKPQDLTVDMSGSQASLCDGYFPYLVSKTPRNKDTKTKTEIQRPISNPINANCPEKCDVSHTCVFFGGVFCLKSLVTGWFWLVTRAGLPQKDLHLWDPWLCISLTRIIQSLKLLIKYEV